MKPTPATLCRLDDPERVLSKLVDVDPRIQLTEAEQRSAAVHKVAWLIDRITAKRDAQVTAVALLETDGQRRVLIELSGGYALVIPETTRKPAP
ncbi:hypothetical protein [Paraburkholderia aspalathi]|uniref:hypothetical protein n=1 Tax=Paraburkholderia aspalathi TaxID=1324617 RepID=UPI001B1C6442|nr:hypothetical protein [Paraburkholderia aspalathi]CAE6846133.1 hypothetical protein R20943_07350 [Paraburkholderia aspalathi]